MKAIHAGTLIDGLADEPHEDMEILVEDGTVTEVRAIEAGDTPPDATVLDHRHQTVLPGLIDAHLHVDGWHEHDPMAWLQDGVPLATARATADLRTLLENGFTTIRDVGSRTGLGLKAAVEEGSIPGPRIYTSERLISQTAGHGDIHFLDHDSVADNEDWVAILADGADECRRETRKLVRKGVDLIKIMTTGGVLSEKDSPYHAHMTDAEIAAVTEEAHRVGIPVASHAEGAEGINNALRNGVDTIEHGFGLDETGRELMHERGAYLVPTFAVMEQYLAQGEEVGVPEYAMEKIHGVKTQHVETVKTAYEEDIPIALGTDFSGSVLAPHGDNAMEASLLVAEVGMDQMDAIKAATSVAAEVLGTDSVGAIEPGRHADVVVLDDDPLQDVDALRRVSEVYKSGESVDV